MNSVNMGENSEQQTYSPSHIIIIIITIIKPNLSLMQIHLMPKVVSDLLPNV